MKVSWRPKALKQLYKLEKDVVERLLKAIDDVDAGTCTPIRLRMPGYVFKVKVGDYRIILELEDQELFAVDLALATPRLG